MTRRRRLLVITMLAGPHVGHAAVDPLSLRRTSDIAGGLAVAATCVNYNHPSDGGPTGGMLRLTGIPAGATILHADLYWTVLSETSPVDAGSPTLDGVPLAPRFVGEVAETPCFDQVATAAFHADANGIVVGDGDYTLQGLPGTGVGDGTITEGATLLVEWTSPGAPRVTIVLYEGVDVTSFAGDTTTQEMSGLLAPDTGPFTATFVAVVGNGQSAEPDTFLFNGVDLETIEPDLLQGASCPPRGLYDLTRIDVSGLVAPGSSSASFELTSTDPGDCHSLAAAALVVENRTCVVAEPSALDRRPDATPLLVSRLSPGSARVTWEAIGSSWQLWRGTIGRWYDHAAFGCALTTPALDVTLGPGDEYYVAAGCGGTASGGRNSFGVERPTSLDASGTACP